MNKMNTCGTYHPVLENTRILEFNLLYILLQSHSPLSPLEISNISSFL